MNKDLDILLNLLNDIDASGKRNLNNLLLCIQITEKLIASQAEEGKE